MRRIGYLFAVAATAMILGAPPVAAKAPYVKKAQDAGHKALVTNCASCHKAKLPTVKDATLNDTLGDWLDKKKKAAGAKEMDFKWLKEYKPQAAK